MLGSIIYFAIGAVIGMLTASDKQMFHWGHFTATVLFWPVLVISVLCWRAWHDKR